MNPLRVGISTQTPLLRQVGAAHSSVQEGSGSQILLSELDNGGNYRLTPGGVCRMVLPSVRAWAKAGVLRHADWFSLQPGGPRRLDFEDLPLTLHSLSLSADELQSYARTKEKIWNDIHGSPGPAFDVEDFRFYSRYNWFTADALLDQAPDLDLAYVHDFQLLQVGALVGLAAPCVLRWHVPFDPSRVPRYTRNFVVRAMEDYDAVIVSTRRDLEGLVNARFHGTVRQLYPAIDTADWPDVSSQEIARFEEEVGLGPDDEVVLCVARMDPMKRQDLLIRALARVSRVRPRAKLLLVGNGSFSGAQKGGLGLSKSERWVQELRDLVRELRLEDRVIFAHWIPDEALAVAYARAQVVALASDIEGFGLTVLEAWRYGRPCVVSAGVGSSEIVGDGLNGFVFSPGEEDVLFERLAELLSDSERRESMGAAGRLALQNYDAREAARRETEVFEAAINRFGE